MECEFPAVQAPDETVAKILKESKTVAVIGLSPNPEKDSYRVAAYLQQEGYAVIPVYPKEETILGEKVHRSLAEIEGVIDIVCIFRKPEALMPIAEAVLERGGVKTFWAQKGIVNNEAAKKVKAAGLQVVQNKCLMVEHRNWKRA